MESKTQSHGVLTTLAALLSIVWIVWQILERIGVTPGSLPHVPLIVLGAILVILWDQWPRLKPIWGKWNPKTQSRVVLTLSVIVSFWMGLSRFDGILREQEEVPVVDHATEDITPHCGWYEVEFIELTVHDCSLGTLCDSVYLQFGAHVRLEYRSLKMGGLKTYPLNVKIPRNMVEGNGIAVSMCAIDSTREGGVNRDWPYFYRVLSHSEARMDSTYEAQESNRLMAYSLKYKIECIE